MFDSLLRPFRRERKPRPLGHGALPHGGTTSAETRARTQRPERPQSYGAGIASTLPPPHIREPPRATPRMRAGSESHRAPPRRCSSFWCADGIPPSPPSAAPPREPPRQPRCMCGHPNLPRTHPANAPHPPLSPQPAPSSSARTPPLDDRLRPRSYPHESAMNSPQLRPVTIHSTLTSTPPSPAPTGHTRRPSFDPRLAAWDAANARRSLHARTASNSSLASSLGPPASPALTASSGPVAPRLPPGAEPPTRGWSTDAQDPPEVEELLIDPKRESLPRLDDWRPLEGPWRRRGSDASNTSLPTGTTPGMQWNGSASSLVTAGLVAPPTPPRGTSMLPLAGLGFVSPPSEAFDRRGSVASQLEQPTAGPLPPPVSSGAAAPAMSNGAAAPPAKSSGGPEGATPAKSAVDAPAKLRVHRSEGETQAPAAGNPTLSPKSPARALASLPLGAADPPASSRMGKTAAATAPAAAPAAATLAATPDPTPLATLPSSTPAVAPTATTSSRSPTATARSATLPLAASSAAPSEVATKATASAAARPVVSEPTPTDAAGLVPSPRPVGPTASPRTRGLGLTPSPRQPGVAASQLPNPSTSTGPRPLGAKRSLPILPTLPPGAAEPKRPAPPQPASKPTPPFGPLLPPAKVLSWAPDTAAPASTPSPASPDSDEWVWIEVGAEPPRAAAPLATKRSLPALTTSRAGIASTKVGPVFPPSSYPTSGLFGAPDRPHTAGPRTGPLGAHVPASPGPHHPPDGRMRKASASSAGASPQTPLDPIASQFPLPPGARGPRTTPKLGSLATMSPGPAAAPPPRAPPSAWSSRAAAPPATTSAPASTHVDAAPPATPERPVKSPTRRSSCPSLTLPLPPGARPIRTPPPVARRASETPAPSGTPTTPRTPGTPVPPPSPYVPPPSSPFPRRPSPSRGRTYPPLSPSASPSPSRGPTYPPRSPSASPSGSRRSSGYLMPPSPSSPSRSSYLAPPSRHSSPCSTFSLRTPPRRSAAPSPDTPPHFLPSGAPPSPSRRRVSAGPSFGSSTGTGVGSSAGVGVGFGPGVASTLVPRPATLAPSALALHPQAPALAPSQASLTPRRTPSPNPPVNPDAGASAAASPTSVRATVRPIRPNARRDTDAGRLFVPSLPDEPPAYNPCWALDTDPGRAVKS